MYADDSVAVRDPATDEWLPLEIEDEPTLAHTWPVLLLKSITGPKSTGEGAEPGAVDEPEPEAAPAPAPARKSRAARRRAGKSK